MNHENNNEEEYSLLFAGDLNRAEDGEYVLGDLRNGLVRIHGRQHVLGLVVVHHRGGKLVELLQPVAQSVDVVVRAVHERLASDVVDAGCDRRVVADVVRTARGGVDETASHAVFQHLQEHNRRGEIGEILK